MKIWNVNIDNIVISKLDKTKPTSKYLIRHSDKAVRALPLIMPKRNGYVKTFKVKGGDEDKNKKLMSFRIDDEKLLEKHKTISTKIADLKNIGFNALIRKQNNKPKQEQTKIRIYCQKVYINFRGINVSENNIECESFTLTSIGSLLAHENKYYLQIYLDILCINIAV